jgi:N-acetylglutamate synthase-like GNAT family acetyltransferase
MLIRNATYHDAPAIKSLLQALGYTSSNSLLVDQLETQFNNGDHQIFVYELRKEVLGFTSVHFLPELGFDGGIAVMKDQGIGEALEDYVTQQARTKKCERIQVHCMDWRALDHLFYKQQGYQEYPKYYTKRLIYAE